MKNKSIKQKTKKTKNFNKKREKKAFYFKVFNLSTKFLIFILALFFSYEKNELIEAKIKSINFTKYKDAIKENDNWAKYQLLYYLSTSEEDNNAIKLSLEFTRSKINNELETIYKNNNPQLLGEAITKLFSES